MICASTCMALATEHPMGSYGYDKAFLKEHKMDTLELLSPDKESRILISAALQGRIMTCSTNGDAGDSFGWINHQLIEKGEVNPQFNPYGGGDRFWLGPEGGAYSLYFKKGDTQVYENWRVPPVIDTLGFDILSQDDKQVSFGTQCELVNASGTCFKIDIRRKVSMLSKEEVSQMLDITMDDSLKCVGYESDNAITNRGDKKWDKKDGLLSIWILGMFNPTVTTTVFIPYRQEAQGPIVNDEYFGKVPAERLIAKDGMLYFKIDGKHRSKIGIPKARALEQCGSYDSAKKVLTLVWFDVAQGEEPYLNGQWGEQKDPYAGDVINAYNDGPVDDGSIMGPFYEIESSSCAKELDKGESLIHRHRTVHIQGDEEKLSLITQKLFGLSVEEISTIFTTEQEQ